METINERIAAIIKATKLTKTAFAERINLSQSYVSSLCIGRKLPSDRTISDICKAFNVDENWLRTGVGEMFVSVESREAEIFAILSHSTGNQDPEFCRRFSAALARLDESGWELLEQLVLKIVGEHEDSADTSSGPKGA